MSFRAARLAVLLLACAPSPAEPAPEPVDACPATARVRLAAPPAGWRPDPVHQYRVRLFGDRIAYSFDSADAPVRTTWLLDPCGGPAEPYQFSRDTELHDLLVIDGDLGAVLYVDDDDVYHLVDRLDVPGADDPRPVDGLPSGASGFAFDGYVLFADLTTEGPIVGAAGLADTFQQTFYTHAGDPDRPAVHIADAIVDYATRGPRLLVLLADGTLRDLDPRTGDGDALLTGVRHIDLSFDDRHLVWQEIGDEQTEPVHLLDLDTGDDREIAVNDFSARSWGADGPTTASVGTWLFTRDSAAAALSGPERSLVAAVRTDTGEPLPVPAHREWQGTLRDDAFLLDLGDPEQHVLAVWTPLTGDLRVYYRGRADPQILHRDGSRLELFVPGDDDPNYGSLRRVDLDTGETLLVAPRLGSKSTRLTDGRYLSGAATGFLSTASGLYFTYDLDLFDPDIQVYWPLGAAIDDWRLVDDRGLLYFDARGPEPGLWLDPLVAR